MADPGPVPRGKPDARRLPLPRGPGRLPDRLFRQPSPLFELLDQIALPADRNILWLKIVFHVDAQFALRQVSDMSDRSNDLIGRAQIFADGFRLGRRFHDDQCLFRRESLDADFPADDFAACTLFLSLFFSLFALPCFLHKTLFSFYAYLTFPILVYIITHIIVRNLTFCNKNFSDMAVKALRACHVPAAGGLRAMLFYCICDALQPGHQHRSRHCQIQPDIAFGISYKQLDRRPPAGRRRYWQRTAAGLRHPAGPSTYQPMQSKLASGIVKDCFGNFLFPEIL